MISPSDTAHIIGEIEKNGVWIGAIQLVERRRRRTIINHNCDKFQNVDGNETTISIIFLIQLGTGNDFLRPHKMPPKK